MTPDGLTRLIIIAGHPTDHIQGYREYEQAIAAAGHNALYLSVDVARENFAPFLDGARHIRNLAGLVLTIPHKVAGFAAASSADTAARQAGSANLLRATATGWHAGNVDGTGFVHATRAAGIAIAGARVQVLGCGGAGRAVAAAIAEQAPASLALHDADAARAADLARRLPARVALEASDLLVNCTPAGMGHDESLPCNEALIPRGGAVFDIVNRIDTPLLVEARARGCRTEWGRAMMLAEVPLILDWMLAPRSA
jgi:shikimate dehydrogenase